GPHDRHYVRFHFAPVRGVHVRGQDHERAAPHCFGGLSKAHGVRGRQGSDARDDRYAVTYTVNGRFTQSDLYVKGQRGALTKRAMRHQPDAASIHQPAAMLGKKRVINATILVELRGDCRNHASPVNSHRMTSSTELGERLGQSETGKRIRCSWDSLLHLLAECACIWFLCAFM